MKLHYLNHGDVRETYNTLMLTYRQAVTECRFFKAENTSMNQMEFIPVSHITTKAQRNVMGNVSSKPSVCNVKSSDGSPGRVLVSRVYKSACVMVFSSHVYE